MKYDGRAKKHLRKKADSNQRAWRFTVIFVSLLTVSISGGWFLWQNKAETLDTTALTASFQRLQHWVAERHGRIKQKMVKVKKLAAQNAEQPIHFEFYSELPNMKVPTPKKIEHNTTEKA